MKKKQNEKISLKKLTIAVLSSPAMGKIKGGDCIPTDVQLSNDHCKPDPTIGMD